MQRRSGTSQRGLSKCALLLPRTLCMRLGTPLWLISTFDVQLDPDLIGDGSGLMTEKIYFCEWCHNCSPITESLRSCR